MDSNSLTAIIILVLTDYGNGCSHDVYGDVDDVGRITKGRLAKEGEFASVVHLQANGMYCGGSLIHKYWVLTAAHCFNVTNNITADVGLYDQKKKELKKSIQSDQLIKHPHYGGDPNLTNDVALVRLKKAVTFVEPMTLAKDPDVTFTAEKCTAIGWGRRNPVANVKTRVLRKYNNWVLPPLVCKLFYPDNYKYHQLCLNGPGGLCKGDSGGPLLCNGIVAGIACYAHINCTMFPSAFTRVSSFYDWIQQTMEENMPEE